jgi:hypothetical protein
MGAPQLDLSIRASVTDLSGTVTSGGVSQVAIAASRNYLMIFIQNLSDQTESLFVNAPGQAKVNNVGNGYASWELLPGSSLEFRIPGPMPVDAISVTAATAGHPFICKIV